MSRALITNNSNTHSPQTWAFATSQQIFDVGATYAENNRVDALKLQTSIAEFLATLHARVQADEQARLSASIEHLGAAYDVSSYVSEGVAGILQIASSTPWAGLFTADPMPASIAAVLGSHFQTVQHIHRQAHARANAAHPDCKAFIKFVTGQEI